MAEDDRKRWEALEEPGEHQPQRMTAGLGRPAEDGLREAGIALERRRDHHRVRHVERRDAFPERQAALVVEIDPASVAVD